jgi:hypothetical protein
LPMTFPRGLYYPVGNLKTISAGADSNQMEIEV